ncbi:MAG: hypothetical protein K6G43_05520 [Lachnospiraceae bacterium]|nr:hypothetical protein [Lachnospiraceae bacterium]
MDALGILGFVFGIMGVLAYCSQSELKKRIKRIEDELAGVKGSSYAVSRESLFKLASANIGKQVEISFKEDCWDTDVISYGNTRGKNVIMDADHDWIAVEISTPKKKINKIFRIDSIDGLTMVNRDGI